MALYSVNTIAALGALEATPGTAETLDSTDYKTKLRNVEAQVTIEYDDEAAKFASGDHGMDLAISGGKKATMKGEQRIAWSGSYATAPDWFKYAQACGHSTADYKRAILVAGAAKDQKVVPVSTSGSPYVAGQVVTLKEGAKTENCVIDIVGTNQLTMVGDLVNDYTGAGYVHTGIALQPLMASDDVTMTCGVYAKEVGETSPDATAITISGAMGNMELVADGIGKPLVATFDLGGKFDAYEDVAFASIPVFSGDCNEVPDTLLGSTLTVAGTAQKVSKFSLSSGNTIETLSDQSDDSGYFHSIITARQPVVTFDPLRSSVATDDVFADASTADGQEIILSTEHFQIRVPKGQFINPQVANREGMFSWEKNYRCLRNCTSGGAALDTVLPTECAYEIIMGRRS